MASTAMMQPHFGWEKFDEFGSVVSAFMRRRAEPRRRGGATYRRTSRVTSSIPTPTAGSENRMGWATAAIEQLTKGETVTVRPRGHSMTGRVNDGDQVSVEPLGGQDPDSRRRCSRALPWPRVPPPSEGAPGRSLPDRQQPRRTQRVD